MGIVPQRTEAIRENHRNIEMKAYGVLTSLILLFSLASAADIQQQLAKENAKLESIRHYINNMKIPLETIQHSVQMLLCLHASRAGASRCRTGWKNYYATICTGPSDPTEYSLSYAVQTYQS